jgi:hypothetical protein
MDKAFQWPYTLHAWVIKQRLIISIAEGCVTAEKTAENNFHDNNTL